jgi:hypothetical protein
MTIVHLGRPPFLGITTYPPWPHPPLPGCLTATALARAHAGNIALSIIAEPRQTGPLASGRVGLRPGPCATNWLCRHAAVRSAESRSLHAGDACLGFAPRGQRSSCVHAVWWLSRAPRSSWATGIALDAIWPGGHKPTVCDVETPRYRTSPEYS